jgi:nucleotide-binding universal stress UspA family protein
VHGHLAAGGVVEALVSVSAFELAKILVVGGEPRPRRPLLGATAERASRRSSVPVLTLRDVDRLLAWLSGDKSLRILVGADGGRASEAARAFAATLGALGPTEIEVVMVVSPAEVHERLGLPPPADEHAVSADVEALLLRELDRSAPAGEAGVRLRVLAGRGSADAHLVGLADQGNFDLVVVGQRRHSLLEQLWYGSVARGVLRASPVSVACVPREAASAKPAFQAPRVVVAATDLGDLAERVVAQALGFVAEGGVVHLVHVVPGASPPFDDARQAREQAWYSLARLGTDEATRPAAVERHVLEGTPADQVLALADRVGADLVVLGARNPSLVTRALVGSVARAVTDRAKVPVLLVPALAG